MTDDLMAWLGPAAKDLTPDQLATVRDASDLIDARWPDQDESDLREAALSAAVQVVLGDTTAADLARHRTATALDAARAVAASTGGAIALVRLGTPKAEAARSVGVDRMTLLKALGER